MLAGSAMIPLQPPAQVQPPAPPPVPLAEAAARLLDAYDQGGEGAEPPEEGVAPADRPSLRWLRAAMAQDLPGNPFPRGSAPWKEAEALRALLQAPAERRGEALGRVTLLETGSQLALWRWGKGLSRAGALPPPLRSAWEDALLGAPLPTLVSAYALRHALCFALAGDDLARFAELKAKFASQAPEQILVFQRLFGILGTPGPPFALWRLPEMTAESRGLGALGGGRVWIRFLEPMAIPALPEGTVWLIPMEKPQDAPPGAPAPTPNAVAAEVIQRLGPGRRAWLSPVPEDLEAEGLSLFPVLLEFEGGNLRRIRMGDAAPAAP